MLTFFPNFPSEFFNLCITFLDSRKSFLILHSKKNKKIRSSHKYISAVGVFQGRRVLTRLIINSCVDNMMPRDSTLLDRHHFPGKWGTKSDTTGDASETSLRVENCL